MHVKKNLPEPVFQPPPTIDIIGLSIEDATGLRDLMGKFRASCGSTGVYPDDDSDHWHARLWDALHMALGISDSKTNYVNEGTNDTWGLTLVCRERD